jgi:hypothetical protein
MEGSQPRCIDQAADVDLFDFFLPRTAAGTVNLSPDALALNRTRLVMISTFEHLAGRS